MDYVFQYQRYWNEKKQELEDRLANIKRWSGSVIRRHGLRVFAAQVGEHHPISAGWNSGGDIEQRRDVFTFREMSHRGRACTTCRRPLVRNHPVFIDLTLEPALAEVVVQLATRDVFDCRLAGVASAVDVPVGRDPIVSRRA